jgi:hypothetical protein
MIRKAAALAEIRGWDFDILSPLQLAVAIPSPRWRFYYTVNLFCSIDGGAWGFVALKDFEVMGKRDPEVSLAVGRLRQLFTPDEIDLLPAPQCMIRYVRDIVIATAGKVENQLGRAIDEALAQIDMAWTVLMLVNWGDKSAAEAIAHVNALELLELSENQSNSEEKEGKSWG